MKLASFPEKMCTRRLRGNDRGRRGRKGEYDGGEGGWLMRIESWGRFSVYVARIRNFGAPNHIQYFELRLSTHTHTHRHTHIYIPVNIQAGTRQGSEKKMDTYFRFAILRLVISTAHMRCIKLENPPKVPPESIKNTDPCREATDRKNNTHALSMYSDGSEWS